MKFVWRAVALGLCLALPRAAAAASPWLIEPGHDLTTLGYASTRTSRLFRDDGSLMDLPGPVRFETLTLGYTASWRRNQEFSIQIPYSKAVRGFPAMGGAFADPASQSGIGDVRLDLKMRLPSIRRVDLALVLGAKFPAAADANDTTLIHNFSDGQRDFDATLATGICFGRHGESFATASVGYRDRRGANSQVPIGTPDLGNEVPIGFTLGHTFPGRFTLSLGLERVVSRGGGALGMVPFDRTREGYDLFGATLERELARGYTLSVGTSRRVRGENTDQGRGWQFAVSRYR